MLTPDPQKLMRLAIKVMKESVPEPRIDGKASPKVGAVLWKPDGTVETACRGELRYGDHAEYTLLERKNRQSRLDGSALFATLEPITLEQMQAFNAPMLSRNPIVHFVFAQMELAEERGLGLKSMRTRAEAAGLPLPTYSRDEVYLVLTIFRSSAAAVRAVPADVLRRLNADERGALGFIVQRDSVTSSLLRKQMGFDERKAQRVLRKLVDLGLVARRGAGSSTYYAAVRS